MSSMGEHCFDFPDAALADDADRGAEYYLEQIATLSKKCWEHYGSKDRSPRSGRSILRETLYDGSLGPCCYLRFRMACSPSFTGGTTAKFRMLTDALSHVDELLLREKRSAKGGGHQEVTLLSGEQVGALTMKIVIGDKVLRMMMKEGLETFVSKGDLMREVQESINRLFQFAVEHILSSALPLSDCEVLMGRAGYLKAIKFIQRELGDSAFGRDVAREILVQICEEGIDVGGGQLLLWKNKQKINLGGLRGISGILHTLLDFEEDLRSINPDIWRQIEVTVQRMDDYCTKTGNLGPSLKTTLPSSRAKTTDKLVQFCCGSPAHALLLAQVYRKSCAREQSGDLPLAQPPEGYLRRAEEVAESVVLPRGLLRKGVGLCHGISGNGFVFLSVHNAVALANEEESGKWMQFARAYANFAIDHLEELEGVPEHPYSLYEGLAGLVCLLLGLVEGSDGINTKFPCFEF